MPTAVFKLHASRYLMWGMYILYALLLLGLVSSKTPHSMLILSVLSMLWSFYRLLQAQYHWFLLAWHQKKGWKIYNTQWEVYNIQIMPSTFCSRFMVILNFLAEGSPKKMSLI